MCRSPLLIAKRRHEDACYTRATEPGLERMTKKPMKGMNMVRYAWIAMLALLTTAGSSTYAADSTNADAQAISKIEQDWNEALKTKNKAFYEKYLSDDFTSIEADGRLVSGRAAYIEGVMKTPAIVEMTTSDEKVRVYGTTGVVTARWTVKDSTGGGITSRYTDVYAKGADGWKVVASQETQIK